MMQAEMRRADRVLEPDKNPGPGTDISGPPQPNEDMMVLRTSMEYILGVAQQILEEFGEFQPVAVFCSQGKRGERIDVDLSTQDGRDRAFERIRTEVQGHCWDNFIVVFHVGYVAMQVPADNPTPVQVGERREGLFLVAACPQGGYTATQNFERKEDGKIEFGDAHAYTGATLFGKPMVEVFDADPEENPH